jgi:hypothetical protein
MNTTHEQHKTELRDMILSLARSCPLNPDCPCDCPLNPVRQLELPQRLEWLSALSEDEMQYLCDYHCVCEQLRGRNLMAELVA